MSNEPVYEVNRCRFIEYMPCSIQAMAITPTVSSNENSENMEKRPVYAALSRGTSGNIELWNLGREGQDIYLDRVRVFILFKFYFLHSFV